MFKIVAQFPVHPEKIEQFRAIVKPLIEASQKEEGCISYDLYMSTTNPHMLVMMEQWKDQAAIDFHNNTPHFTTIVAKLANYLTDKPVIDIYKPID